MAKSYLLAKIGVKLDADTINYINDIKKAQIETDKRLEQIEGSYKKAGKAGDQVTNSMKRQRAAATQLGFQLQDVAVQAQMGTSWFTIIGQQGSQLASVLGPGGALFGAAIAIGAAFGGVLYKALTGAGDAVEDFNVDAREMTNTLEKLAEYGKAQQLVISDKARENLEADKEKLDDLSKSLSTVQAKLANGKKWENFGDHIMPDWREVDLSAKEIAELTDKQRLLGAEVETVNKDMEKHNELIGEITTGAKGYADGTFKQKEKLKELVSTLAEEVRTYKMSAAERDIDTASRLGASKATLEQIRNQHALLNLYENQKKAEEELAAKKKQAEAAALQSASKVGPNDDKLKAERAARKADYDQGLIDEQMYQSALNGIRRREMEAAAAEAAKSADRGQTLEQKLEAERQLHRDNLNKQLIDKEQFNAAMRGIAARELEYELAEEQKRLREEEARRQAAETKEAERIARERQLATDMYNFKLQQDLTEQQRLDLQYQRERELLEQWLSDQLQMYADNEEAKKAIRDAYQEQQEAMDDINRQAKLEATMGDLDTIAAAFGKQTGMAKKFAMTQLAISEALSIGKELEKGFPAAIPGVIAMVAKFAALAGQFHGGTDSVPESMDNKSFMLKAGERVVQPEANKKLTKFLDGQNANTPMGEGVKIEAPMTIHGNVTDEKWFKQELYKHREAINASVKKAARERPARRR